MLGDAKTVGIMLRILSSFSVIRILLSFLLLLIIWDSGGYNLNYSFKRLQVVRPTDIKPFPTLWHDEGPRRQGRER